MVAVSIGGWSSIKVVVGNQQSLVCGGCDERLAVVGGGGNGNYHVSTRQWRDK